MLRLGDTMPSLGALGRLGLLARLRSKVERRHAFPQFPQAVELVDVLGTVFLRLHNNATRLMSKAHGTFRLVDVLTARSARAERLDLALVQQILIGLWQDNAYGFALFHIFRN